MLVHSERLQLLTAEPMGVAIGVDGGLLGSFVYLIFRHGGCTADGDLLPPCTVTAAVPVRNPIGVLVARRLFDMKDSIPG